jgi:hypothetical protein
MTALVVGGPIAPADVPGLCARARALLAAAGGAGDAGVLLCDVGALARPDMATIHALARLQLTARRHGARMVVRRASPELRDLLAFAGLADAVPAAPSSVVEPVGQTEQREEPRRVEERVEPRDPAV